jgi:adenylate cyclase class 2
MAQKGRETEIKLPMSDAQSARRLLRAAGFRVSRPRRFESNLIFDTPESDLRQRGTALRLRHDGGGILTYKGPPKITKHKSREELETAIGDVRTMAKILDRLGFRVVFRYEKYRTEFRRPPGPGVAMLDETPVGVYLELEGPPRWIDATARRLGFTHRDYITTSYIRLYLDQAQQRGGPADRMGFRRS